MCLMKYPVRTYFLPRVFGEKQEGEYDDFSNLVQIAAITSFYDEGYDECPFALARSIPALIRSRMIDHSNSANTPHI